MRNTSMPFEKAVRKEFDIMKALPHENIVRAYELSADDINLYLTLELLEGGELIDHVRHVFEKEAKGYSEIDAAGITLQILEGLEAMHERGIAHWDLKPQNVMFVNGDRNRVKLIDFGLAQRFGVDPEITKFRGTAHYCAPEMLENQHYGVEADLWSVGCIVYLLLTGRQPFFEPNINILSTLICSAEYDRTSETFSSLSPFAKKMISNLLCVDHGSRWTAKEAIENCRLWVKEVGIREGSGKENVREGRKDAWNLTGEVMETIVAERVDMRWNVRPEIAVAPETTSVLRKLFWANCDFSESPSLIPLSRTNTILASVGCQPLTGIASSELHKRVSLDLGANEHSEVSANVLKPFVTTLVSAVLRHQPKDVSGWMIERFQTRKEVEVSGGMSFTDFVVAVVGSIQKSNFSQDILEFLHRFNELDTNGDLSLSTSELAKLLREDSRSNGSSEMFDLGSCFAEFSSRMLTN
jgi:hypothetical protein